MSAMNLSYKDLQFIREAIANLIKTDEKRLDVTEDEDEASDLGNDCKFLEALGRDIDQTLEFLLSLIEQLIKKTSELIQSRERPLSTLLPSLPMLRCVNEV